MTSSKENTNIFYIYKVEWFSFIFFSYKYIFIDNRTKIKNFLNAKYLLSLDVCIWYECALNQIY